MEGINTSGKSEDGHQRKDGDPGAVKLGNFKNYYQFRPPEDRIKQLSIDVWLQNHEPKTVCLDVGCNSGDLTQAVYQHVNAIVGQPTVADVKPNECFILGVDIDPILMLRAEETNRFRDHITYKTLDIMSKGSKTVLITMWIHLNHGDNGLKKFLHRMCDLTELLIIEPQPWKCYLAAVRRLKKSNVAFPNIGELRMNRKVDDNIEDIIQNKHKFTKIHESHPTSWGRKIVFFKRSTS